jgi:hypothetical protein
MFPNRDPNDREMTGQFLAFCFFAVAGFGCAALVSIGALAALKNIFEF